MNNNCFRELNELGDIHAKIKESQDTLLDMFHPEDTRVINLLKELCSLEQEYEKLYGDFEIIAKQELF